MISGVLIIVVTGAPGSGKDMFLEDVAADPWFDGTRSSRRRPLRGSSRGSA